MNDRPRREVWILRHAKAVPHTSDDHARPLTDRGRRQCAELAAHLIETAGAPAVPGTVLVSSAVRARQTAELVVDALGGTARVEVRPELYQADPDDVIELLRELTDDVPSVMVVGHNPTLEQLVWLLLDPDDDTGWQAAERGLSTGALVAVSADTPIWATLTAGSGRLRLSYTPKAR